jgi:hypothetical protein
LEGKKGRRRSLLAKLVVPAQIQREFEMPGKPNN